MSLEQQFLTGAPASHDIDDKIPRTQEEIFGLNRLMTDKMRDTFGDVPVVPTVGNNDVFPHNVMFPGPSRTTTEYAEYVRSIPSHLPCAYGPQI